MYRSGRYHLEAEHHVRFRWGHAVAKTLAEKTEWLFQNVRNPEDDQPYSNARIAAKIERLSGFSVTPTTVWNIRTGKSENPSWRLIEGLARAFGISPLYFTDDEAAQQTQEELALLAALRDAGVRNLALRAQGLSPQSLATVRDLIERVRELEGLMDDRRRLDRQEVQSAQDALDGDRQDMSPDESGVPKGEGKAHA